MSLSLWIHWPSMVYESIFGDVIPFYVINCYGYNVSSYPTTVHSNRWTMIFMHDRAVLHVEHLRSHYQIVSLLDHCDGFMRVFGLYPLIADLRKWIFNDQEILLHCSSPFGGGAQHHSLPFMERSDIIHKSMVAELPFFRITWLEAY